MSSGSGSEREDRASSGNHCRPGEHRVQVSSRATRVGGPGPQAARQSRSRSLVTAGDVALETGSCHRDSTWLRWKQRSSSRATYASVGGRRARARASRNARIPAGFPFAGVPVCPAEMVQRFEQVARDAWSGPADSWRDPRGRRRAIGAYLVAADSPSVSARELRERIRRRATARPSDLAARCCASALERYYSCSPNGTPR